MGRNFHGHFTAVQKARKREKIMLLGVVGLATCLFLILLVSFDSGSATASKFGDASDVVAPPTSGTVTLFTPARHIKSGTKVSKAEFKEIYWPRGSVPEGAIMDLSEITDWYSKADIPVGEPLRRSHLSQEALEKGTLNITPGMRAVTIEVNSKRGLEGWALPGSRIDLVLTYMEEGELTSKVVVENSRVLSLGGDSSRMNERLPSGRKKVKVSPTVTLEVKPKDALKIETALKLGSLSLHMRSPEDDKASGIDSVGKYDLSGSKNRKSSNKVQRCKKGKMKIGGKQYLVDCDGSLVDISSSR